MPRVISLWIPCLELNKEFQGGLIGLRFQALKHLLPVSFEGIWTAAARLSGKAAILEPADDAPGTGILAPDFHALCQRLVLPTSEPTRELRAELLEELSRVDVWEPFETPT